MNPANLDTWASANAAAAVWAADQEEANATSDKKSMVSATEAGRRGIDFFSAKAIHFLYA